MHSYVTQDDNLLPWRRSTTPFPIEVQGRLDETRAHAEMLVGAVGSPASSYYLARACPAACASAALIRTLAYDLPVILMDEPFAAVDAQTRAAAGRPAAAVEPQAQDHHLRHPRHHRGDRARRPRWCSAGSRRGSPPSTRSRSRACARSRIFSRSRVSPRCTNASARPSNDASRSHRSDPVRSAGRVAQMVALGGRVVLAVLLVLGWSWARARSVCSSRRRSMWSCGSPSWRRAAAFRRCRLDAPSVGAGLRHRLRRRSPAAVPVAPVAAPERGGRALHHGLDGHSQIRARALAHPLVRHWRHAQARGRDADGVLHHLHHDHGRHSRRRSAPGQHGAQSPAPARR